MHGLCGIRNVHTYSTLGEFWLLINLFTNSVKLSEKIQGPIHELTIHSHNSIVLHTLNFLIIIKVINWKIRKNNCDFLEHINDSVGSHHQNILYHWKIHKIKLTKSCVFFKIIFITIDFMQI